MTSTSPFVPCASDVSEAESSLASLGFSPHFERAFARHRDAGLTAGRVALEHRGGFVLLTPRGVEHEEISAELSGRMRHEAASRLDLPSVGDWVAFRPAPGRGAGIIHALLPRRTAFVRAVAGGRTEAQVVAANVDVALLVGALGGDVNLRRLERYISLAHASGAEVAVVLTKADLASEDGVSAQAAEVEAIAAKVPVHVVSSVTGVGIDALRAYFEGHRTVTVLGSSGAGKSTLVNRLVGESRQVIGPMGADGRGQHTTTHRELVRLPGGGLVLDTPGMRELRLWDADEGLDETFADVAALAADCRFRDCTHEGEPGCAIAAALADGGIDPHRWASYEKLQRETAALALRKDARAAAEAKRRIKVLSRGARERSRMKG